MKDIGNALRRTGRDELAIKSIIANTIKDHYEHDIDILSVNVRGKKILIKTSSQIASSELQLLEGIIKKASLEKLCKMGIQLSSEIRMSFI